MLFPIPTEAERRVDSGGDIDPLCSFMGSRKCSRDITSMRDVHCSTGLGSQAGMRAT